MLTYLYVALAVVIANLIYAILANIFSNIKRKKNLN